MAAMEPGLVHLYTGTGKGKTTAAWGLALRAAGHGRRVKVIEFLKGPRLTGEHLAARKLGRRVSVRQIGGLGFFFAPQRRGAASPPRRGGPGLGPRAPRGRWPPAAGTWWSSTRPPPPWA